MLEITQLLDRVSQGDDDSLKLVFDRLYGELRTLAAKRLGGGGSATLTPTVLVHEVFERLIGAQQLRLVDRRHFYACTARAMRMIIVDHARKRTAKKRTPEAITLTLTDEQQAIDALDLDAALDALNALDSRARELVALRFYAGLTMDETAEILDISLRTANREWQKARAFLYAQMKENPRNSARDSDPDS